MGKSKQQLTITVSIDCPVCSSGNRFRLGAQGAGLDCDDCGFVMAEAVALKTSYAGSCVFCGGEYFYVESPLSLHLLGEAAVCYVCGAKYKGGRTAGADKKFSPGTLAKAGRSDAAERWRKRVESYNQGAG